MKIVVKLLIYFIHFAIPLIADIFYSLITNLSYSERVYVSYSPGCDKLMNIL